MVSELLTKAGSIAAIVAAIFGYVLWRSERNQELSRLKALYQHLDFIKNSAEGHERHLRDKRLPPPSWPIANIDLNFYLTNIKFKVREEGSICLVKTKELKKHLISLYEKVNTINYLWRLLIEKPRIRSDLTTNTYYQDLYGFIKSAKSEIEKIVGV